MVKVAVIVGSLRREWINRNLALALKKLGRRYGLDLSLVGLADLPHYNQDLWADPPAAVTRLKRDVEAADAVIFVTPEYNRAPPGLVKDAVDWASRPYGKNSWAGKPAAVIGATTGKVGTAVAQSHLRATLLVLDLAVMGQPEAYIQLPAEFDRRPPHRHRRGDPRLPGEMARRLRRLDRQGRRHRAGSRPARQRRDGGGGVGNTTRSATVRRGEVCRAPEALLSRSSPARRSRDRGIGVGKRRGRLIWRGRGGAGRGPRQRRPMRTRRAMSLRAIPRSRSTASSACVSQRTLCRSRQ